MPRRQTRREKDLGPKSKKKWKKGQCRRGWEAGGANTQGAKYRHVFGGKESFKELNKTKKSKTTAKKPRGRVGKDNIMGLVLAPRPEAGARRQDEERRSKKQGE